MIRTATPDLREGDIVRHRGMRLLVANHREIAQWIRGVYAADGIVLNFEEVDEAALPVGWSDRDAEGRPVWSIQGNKLCTWAREA